MLIIQLLFAKAPDVLSYVLGDMHIADRWLFADSDEAKGSGTHNIKLFKCL